MCEILVLPFVGLRTISHPASPRVPRESPKIGQAKKAKLPVCRPIACKESRNFARFFGTEAGTVFGTVNVEVLEP
jgi:hypothetical protein